MEKIGVEVVKTKEEIKAMEKNAQRKVTQCSHPTTRVYTDNGVSYCRQCEKYLKIGN